MIYLRKAKEIDIEKLYISLNKKYVEKNKKNVSKLENRYKEWYKNLIESDKFILLIIENENNDFIGHIKYEMKSEEVEVLIFILEKYRNNGIGKKALEESFMYIDKNIYEIKFFKFSTKYMYTYKNKKDIYNIQLISNG